MLTSAQFPFHPGNYHFKLKTSIFTLRVINITQADVYIYKKNNIAQNSLWPQSQNFNRPFPKLHHQLVKTAMTNSLHVPQPIKNILACAQITNIMRLPILFCHSVFAFHPCFLQHTPNCANSRHNCMKSTSAQTEVTVSDKQHKGLPCWKGSAFHIWIQYMETDSQAAE